MDKLYGLIQGINPKEICNHIENGNLAEWCNAWRIAAKEALQPKTNADRIRAMSDEEMAKVLNAFTAYFEECNRSLTDTDCHDCELCELCSLGEGKAVDWLKQPAE